jgi:uncharacterized SAM-binding protein YcdF (DUF218 family)
MQQHSHDIIIVLGAPNDQLGKLSMTSRARADLAVDEYIRRANCIMILAGGFGRHFNQAPLPHSSYLRKYVVARGVAEVDIRECPSTSNTVEDAVHTKPLVKAIEHQAIVVVTSAFHVARAGMIFRAVFASENVQVLGAQDDRLANDYERLIAHERQAIRQLEHQTGVRVLTAGIEKFYPLR